MALGPGKYDDACTLVREMTGGTSVVVAVMGGNKGAGFSVQSTAPIPPKILAYLLADMLEAIAEELRKSSDTA